MSLAAGTRLGSYEILSLLGAGGMGEVYRARDARLGRDVAIKVLPASFGADRDALTRFEREARAVAALNHPNILSIFDFGTHEGTRYAVMELLEGKTLREKLDAGALPKRRAVETAVQIARGLAAAHGKGIVHRDLKPENVFLTDDNRVKILDFGLAKTGGRGWPGEAGEGDTRAPTLSALTEPGTVMGTVGYMSPEQVEGKAADARSDIFSFGALLYEMLSGRRAFHGDSAVATMGAILKEEPGELTEGGRGVSPALDRIVRHCLEKSPAARFQSAQDLVFALEDASPASGTGTMPPASGAGGTRWRRARPPFFAATGLIVAAAAGHFLWRTASPAPQFHRLTFRRGIVTAADFAPGGAGAVFSAAWEGRPVELFLTEGESPEARSLGFSGATLLDLSPAGELAMLVDPQPPVWLGGYRGTLARAPLTGGALHPVLDNVVLANWAPRGDALSVARAVGARVRVEFPIGHPVYETDQNLLAMKVSPDGTKIAIAEHPSGFGTNGSVSVLSLSGKKTTLVRDALGNFADLAWSPSGKEIWYEFGIEGSHSLWAVNLSGRRRRLLRLPDRIQLFDVSGDGKALVNKVDWRVGVLGSAGPGVPERDLSWLDVTEVDDVSPDGREILLTEFGEGGGPRRWSVYLRETDGSPAVRLGDGQAMQLSPDGKWALAMRRTTPPQLVLWATGAGEPKPIPNDGITDYLQAVWLRDGKGILFSGIEPGRAPRCFVENLDGTGFRAVTEEGTVLPITEPALSPDGRSFFAVGPDHLARIYSLSGGPPRSIPGIAPWETPVGWSADGQDLFVARLDRVPVDVDRLDLISGKRETWKRLMPSNPAGVVNLYAIHLSSERGWYFYSYTSALSDLYVVDNLR